MRCRIERAEEALTRTIEHARRAGDERVDAYARGMLAAAAFWGPLPVPDGTDRCRRLLAETAGNRYVECSVLHVLAALAAMQGRFDQARDLVDRGAEVAAALGRLRLAAIWSQFAATVESLAGRPEAAEERLQRGYRALERMGETGARSNLAADLAHALVAGGRHEEARRFADLSRALAAREDVYAQVRWRAATARALAADGDPGRAGQGGGRAGRGHRHAQPPGRRLAGPGHHGRAGRPARPGSAKINGAVGQRAGRPACRTGDCRWTGPTSC
jgi:ATP/maltotriose-dependent transcriptional regulator MalT